MTGADEGLGVVEEFLNTLDERTFRWHGENHVFTDELSSVDALTAWLGAHGLGVPGQELGQADLAAALSLRTALRRVLSDDPDGDAAAALAGFPLRLVPDRSGRLRLAAGSGPAGLDVLVEIVAGSVARGAWGRLKLCASADCRWAFYDTSRSGGGRWCSMEVCGNRHKTRAYRQRRAG